MSGEFGICAGYLLPHPPVIVPEVGLSRENEAAATISAYKSTARDAASLKPDTVVVISPHAPLFSDYAFMYDEEKLTGSFSKFGAPNIKLSFSQDGELRSEIENLMRREGIPGGSVDEAGKRRLGISDELDHGVLVPLYYFSSIYKSFRLVAMSCSGLDMQCLYKIGRIIRQAALSKKRRIVIIASGDMSHKVNAKSPYGACPEGEIFDNLIKNGIQKNDIPALLSIDAEIREKSAECGYRSLVILCGTFDGEKPKTTLLSSEAPFGIGYCAAKFMPTGEKADDAFAAAHPKIDRKDENEYCAVARAALESYITKKTVLSSSEFSRFKENAELFSKKAGVFVSLKKFGELRGCIGTTQATEEIIADEIIRNAVSAGTRDPRFEPVTADELDFIEYSVDVLSPYEPANIAELDPKKYGVIVKSGRRSGLLLPDLEGVDTATRQLEIACQKAGINPNEHFDIYRFTVTRHKAKKEGD